MKGVFQMNEWSKVVLDNFIHDEAIKIEPFYDDGKTNATPVTIWFVIIAGRIYIRAYHGHDSKWYQAAIKQGAGQITAGNQTYQVNFTAVSNNTEMGQRINQAYHQKYEGQSPLEGMTSPAAIKAAICITPKQD